MKLTQEQKEDFKKHCGDWEMIHTKYSTLLAKRMKELDSEFLRDIEGAIKEAIFIKNNI